MNTFERIYQVVRSIPRGCVATYGQVARLAGNPRWSRVVGYALHQNPSQSEIPCHRVVDRMGRVAKGYVFGGDGVQKTLLEQEGVVFTPEGAVDFGRCLWKK